MSETAHDDAAIAAAIMAVLAQRRPPASACPSEAARRLAPAAWRPLMPSVRRVAAGLALQQMLHITQKGAVLDPEDVLAGRVRGPLRLRRLA